MNINNNLHSHKYYKNLVEKLNISKSEPKPSVKKFDIIMHHNVSNFKALLNSYHQNLEKKNQKVELKQHESESIKIITQLYTTVLHRSPDNDGLKHWVDKYNNGMSIASIKYIMMNSKEGKKVREYINRKKNAPVTNKYHNYGFKTIW